MKMKKNVGIQTVRRKWGHVLKWKKWKKMIKIERKLKENEEKWKKRWRQMKENEGHNCFH